MKKAYVTLLSVIVLGAIFSVFALLLLDIGLSSNMDTLSWQSELKARAAATACVERVLYQLTDGPSKEEGKYLLSDSTCEYKVRSDKYTEIYSVGSSANNVFRLHVVVDQIKPKINIKTWEEVTDF